MNDTNGIRAAALTTAQVAALAEMPTATLHSWVQSGRVAPSIEGRRGRRFPLRWSLADAVAVRCLARLRRAGISGQECRRIQETVTAAGDALAGCTLAVIGGEVFNVGADGAVTALVEQPGQTALTTADVLAAAADDDRPVVSLPVGRWREEAADVLSETG